MSAATFTFRCYQCQKLLGVSRSRIGSVVNCPKCGAELLVPDPDAIAEPQEAAPTDPAPAAPQFPAGLFTTEPAAPGAEGTGSFFPEIRTEPISLRSETFGPRPTTSAKPPSGGPPSASDDSPLGFLQTGLGGEPAESPFPFVNIEPPAPAPLPPPVVERPRQKRPRPRPASEPPSAKESSSATGFPMPGASFDAPSSTGETTLPTVEYSRPATPSRVLPPEIAPSVNAWPSSIEESSISSVTTVSEPLREAPSRPRFAERDDMPRRNDVAIPRTAVVLWSFFVLLALVAAFGAGLLCGHFLWK